MQAHGAQADGDNFPVDIIETDPVAHPERAVEQQEQAGHQRSGNVFQGKAQRHGDGAPGGEHEFLGGLQHPDHQRDGADGVEHKTDQGRDLQNQEAPGGHFLGDFLACLADAPVQRPQHQAADKQQHQGVDIEQFHHDGQVVDDISIIH